LNQHSGRFGNNLRKAIVTGKGLSCKRRRVLSPPCMRGGTKWRSKGQADPPHQTRLKRERTSTAEGRKRAGKSVGGLLQPSNKRGGGGGQSAGSDSTPFGTLTPVPPRREKGRKGGEHKRKKKKRACSEYF